MVPDDLSARLRAEAAAAGIRLTDAQTALLRRHLDLVRSWRGRAGLTAVVDPRDGARLHVADSLLSLRAGFPDGAAVLDVGSGAGFPGVPLCVVRPDLRATLLEADGRKAAFLEMVARELALSFRVVCARAEDAARDPGLRERFDVVVARAVAALPVLCELTLPFLVVGGCAVLLKGPASANELPRAGPAIESLGGGGAEVLGARLAGGERRALVIVRKMRPTPGGYPRRAGVPRRRPLR